MALETSTAPATRGRLFSGTFALVCLVAFGAYGSFYLLLPTLPVYVVRGGGSDAEAGLINGIFSVAALAVRPLTGQLTDRWGRRKLAAAGLSLFVVSALGYGLTSNLFVLLALRALHGIGFAGVSTALLTVAGDLAPPARRGEALASYGMFMNLSLAIGPGVGLAIIASRDERSFWWLFGLSAGIALLAALGALWLPGRASTAPPGRWQLSLDALFNRKALAPAAVLTTLGLTYASVISFVPLLATRRGIGDSGLFFTAYAVTLIAARVATGRLSDRFGRAAVIMPGLVMGAAGMAVLALAHSLWWLLLAGLLFAGAFASIQPILYALTVDRVTAAQRGAAMSTIIAAMDLGIGFGSLIWGLVADNLGLTAVYWVASGVMLSGLGIFLGLGLARGPKSEARGRTSPPGPLPARRQGAGG